MPGYTQESLRQDFSMASVLQAMRYIFAVGPPRSEMMPVKPSTLSRISSISCMMDFSERLWMIRPSCSVIEQKVKTHKQQPMILTENRIIYQATILAPLYSICGLLA